MIPGHSVRNQVNEYRSTKFAAVWVHRAILAWLLLQPNTDSNLFAGLEWPHPGRQENGFHPHNNG